MKCKNCIKKNTCYKQKTCYILFNSTPTILMMAQQEDFAQFKNLLWVNDMKKSTQEAISITVITNKHLWRKHKLTVYKTWNNKTYFKFIFCFRLVVLWLNSLVELTLQYYNWAWNVKSVYNNKFKLDFLRLNFGPA